VPLQTFSFQRSLTSYAKVQAAPGLVINNRSVVQREFGQGADSRLLIDTPSRRVESLYVEATSAPVVLP